MNACGLCVGVKHREVPNSHKSLYVQIRVAIRPAMVPSSVTTFWAGIDKDHPNRPRTKPTRVYALARISLSRIAGTKRSPDAGSQYPSKASSSTAVSTSHGNSAGSPGMGTGGMIRSRSRAPSRTTSTGSCSPPSFRTIAPRTRPPSTENTNVTWCGVGSAARACPALLSRHVPEIVWMSRSISTSSRNPASSRPTGSPPAPVQRQQLADNLLVGHVREPTVRTGHSRVKSRVRIDEALRAGVVEVRQRALLQRPCRLLVAGGGPLRIAGNRLVDPLNPFRRIQPTVAQLDRPSGFPWLPT